MAILNPNDPYQNPMFNTKPPANGNGAPGIQFNVPQGVMSKVMKERMKEGKPQPANLTMRPNFFKDRQGTVIFEQTIELTHPKSGAILQRFPPICLTLAQLIALTAQGEAFAAEPEVPEWAQVYYRKRNKCPKCGKDVDYGLGPVDWTDKTAETYKDTQRLKCECGWSGMLDELK